MEARGRNRKRGRGGARLLAAFSVLLAAALLPAGAGAASRAPLDGKSTLGLPAPGGEFPDALIHVSRSLARASASAPHTQTFAVLGGERVEISSSDYSDADLQSVADVLGGLVHGEEMNSLSVYVASPAELTQICGQGALACYAPGISEMVISGVDGSAYGVPRDYSIAHEYGHHIANHRLNAPWTALDTGAKRWATYERVCQGTRRRLLFPGDEGAHYWENPGEAFAETNAHLDFHGVAVPFGYSELLRPTRASLNKLYADITRPWSEPTTATWNGSLWPGRRNPAIHRFSTPLDGQVQVNLSGPPAANYDLYLLGSKLASRYPPRHHRRARPRRRVIERAESSGASEQLELTACGQSSITVEVRRRGGEGPFTVGVTRP